MLPPGYVSISTAEKVWVDNGVSIEVLNGDSVKITSSSISDNGFKAYSKLWFPTDLTIILNFVWDLKPIKLAVML